ncbi:MAG: hypothetical protein LBB81_00295 [Treponema sp.]|jgi:hypothetical protein|nr:hypothetical protein [Treponema sp.]
MELQKTYGNNLFGSTVKILSQSAKTQKTQIVQTSELQQTSPKADIKTLTAALGLPADKLSASIISFARFFSLPFNKELLADIRRQTAANQLKSHNTVTPDNNSKASAVKATDDITETPLLKTPAAVQSRIALVLAGADSKGVVLNNEGLQTYSAAIDPDAHQERQSKERKRQKRDDDQDEHKNKTAPLSADKIRQTALESLIDNPLLNMLNSLPDASGRRWIVLPFEYYENGKSLKVSLRFFLEQDRKTVKQMVLDIAESENRWVFIINNEFKLTLYIEPHLSDARLQTLETELSRGLSINHKLVKVKNMTVDFPLESGSEDTLPLSVNEAV